MSGEVVDFSGREISMRVQIYGHEAGVAQYVALSDFLDTLAERDRARDIAARLEGELARVRGVVVDARSRAIDKPQREWMRIVSPTWEHGTVGYVVHRRDDQVYLSSQTFGLWFDAAELEPADDPEWEPTDWAEGYVDACDEILEAIDELPHPDAVIPADGA